ncbi:helicase-related protein [Marispirochaeta sp.]|uniref:helicase-related protein n=1 Tax=Marispirochaeta sp. TaxID=2038653 RepID=UPI0029C62C0C|nr:helicase-related protein [Marispirochaeta sp.]
MSDYTFNNSRNDGENPDDYLKHFGLNSLFPYQRSIIEEICVACGATIAGTDGEAPSRGLILLPTGAGKSICYMLPALIIPGYSLIIYPLNALISDQLGRFKSAGISALSLAGGTGKREKTEAVASASAGSVRVLLANPESLANPDIQQTLTRYPPRHVVFDEAHTSAEWGLTFRPSYLRVCEFIRELDPVRTSAFTATASPELLPRMADLIFGNKAYSLYSKSPAKENISFSAIPSICPEADILRLVNSTLESPMIIFCRRRSDAENTARLLSCRLDESGSGRIRFYHAGLSKDEKQKVESWFMGGGDLILCATCAFGLGVDCPGVRSVVHLGPPSSVEAYVQETGRAGRDGKYCRAILLFSPEDLYISRDAVSEKRSQDLLSSLLCNTRCRRASLMSLFAPDEHHIPCGICDVCTGTIQSMPQGFPAIMGMIDRYRGMLRLKDAAEILKGYYRSSLSDTGTRSRFFGILKDWDYNWCQEAVAKLLLSGSLYRTRFSRRLSPKVPWRD